MVRKVSTEIEKEIVEKYWDYTAIELGEIYDINPNTIKGIWRRNGCRGKKAAQKFSPNKKEFTDYYLSHSVQETAEYYKKDRHTITRFAQKIEIYTDEKKLTSEQKDEIVNKYYDYTAKELSQEYNVSESYISQIWMKAGLKGKSNRQYQLNETFFDVIDTDEKAYWAGFIAADGCLYYPKDTRKNIISIGLSIEDKKYLEKFTRSLKTNKPISLGVHGEHHQYEKASIQISSNKLVKGLEKIGLQARKTHEILWPKIEPNFLPAYIRGYFDGDGSISKHFEKNELHKVNVTIAGYKDNLQCFQKFFIEQGIDCTFTEDKRKNKNKKQQPFGFLNFPSKKDKFLFLHLIYDNADIYLTRKYVLATRFFEFYEQNPVTWKIRRRLK